MHLTHEFKGIVVLWISLAVTIPVDTVADSTNESGQQAQILAPGYGRLAFTAPVAGTYQLPVLGQASDGQVIDTDGTERSLTKLMRNHVVLLSFIYSTCNDVNGCPLATSVLHRVKQRLSKEPELIDQVRLITVSFNPEFDTPSVMKKYAKTLQGGTLDWQFLTTRSEQQLQPILKNYQQSRQQEYDENGELTGTYSHILRVFLIDREERFRNIYSVSFLHPDTLVNDIKTLLLEDSKVELAFNSKTPESIDNNLAPRYRAGDKKAGYDRSSYQTQSLALQKRIGKSTDLLQYALEPPLGLPELPVPADNSLTTEKIQLGRKLFFDRRLSLNNTVSCAMCHVPEQGFTSNELATSVGIEGRTVKRNAPTIYNVAYAKLLFHDGRENTLEQQIWGPLLAHNEMANPSVGAVIDKINHRADYVGLFEKAFGRTPSMETIGMALASYQRTLNSGDSPFDRYYYGKQTEAISEQAKKGLQLFLGKAGCASCHRIDADSALFMDNQLHNTGLGFREAMLKQPSKQRVQLAPGVFVDVDATVVNAVAEPKPNDLGRYEVTQAPEDRWAYKTPTLRNIALTAPYMHNGSFTTLKQVVEFYNNGGVANKNLDPLLKPLTMNKTEMDDLVAFLNTLTGNNVAALVADAFAAPVGDTQ
ncbi:MAG: cytochrome c peroxidase [Methylococcaceae bacterium]